MAKYKETILVFLAYISDVEDEVSECQGIVRNVNINNEALEISIDLRTWKDVPPDYGNPQENINKSLVENCDVFIGIIWKKWGTPTGKTDCGFKEEFLIAEDRFDKTKNPSIWLYAKEVDDCLITEVERGHYDKVKNFKEEIILKNKGFIVTFKDKQDLKEKIFSRFTRFVIDRYVAKQKKETGVVSDKSIETKYSPTKKVSSASLPREIKQLGKEITSYINNNQDLANLNDFKKIRLFLLSSSLFYNSLLYDVLGNHEIQLIYSHREKIRPIGFERRIIIRTLLNDPYNHKTGWFWLRVLKIKVLENFIVYILHHDSNEDVRFGALSFLERFWLKKYLKNILWSLKDGSNKVLLKVLEILEKKGDKSCITSIDPFLSSPDAEIGKTAWRAKFAINTRTDLDSAIKFLLDFSDLRNNYTQYLKEISDKISVEQLKTMTKDQDREIREFGYLGLISKKQLSDEEIESLSTSDIEKVRRASLLEQIRKGKKIDLAKIKSELAKQPSLSLLLGGFSFNYDEITLEIYSRNDKDKVLSDIDWLSEDGPLAYYALYHFFDEPLDQVRADLENNFGRIKQSYVDKYKELANSALQNKLQQPSFANISEATLRKDLEKETDDFFNRLNGLDKSIVPKYTIYALKILDEKGNSSDVKFARRFFSSSEREIQGVVINMISKWGDEGDIPGILKFSFDSHGNIKEKSAKLAIHLDAERKNNIAENYLDSNDEILIKISLQSDLKQKINSFREKAKSLLLHDNSNIRLYALSYLVNISKGLHVLLKEYLANKTYYYDIVCWLDRILFSHKKYRNAYKKELINKIL